MNADRLKSSADEALNKFLDPVSGGSEYQGWKLGKPVIVSDIITILQNINGVVCIKNISLSEKVSGQNGTTINLPRIGMPFPDIHTITIVTD
jgi:hypothetical protein